jgi:hypothetical protein
MNDLQLSTTSIKTAGRKTNDLIKLKPSVAFGQIAKVVIPKSQLLALIPIPWRVGDEALNLVFDLAIPKAYEQGYKV